MADGALSLSALGFAVEVWHYCNADSGVHTSPSQLKPEGLGSLCFSFPCLVMKALYLVLVLPWVSRLVDMEKAR